MAHHIALEIRNFKVNLQFVVQIAMGVARSKHMDLFFEGLVGHKTLGQINLGDLVVFQINFGENDLGHIPTKKDIHGLLRAKGHKLGGRCL